MKQLIEFLKTTVMGGDFWDKIRSLFIYGATATFPKPL